MSTGYQIYNQHAPYFLTFTIVDWVDVFTRKVYKDIIIDSLSFCQNNKGLRIFGYVIMSNHLHLIVQAIGEIPLSDIIRDFKKYTANNIIKIIQSENESRSEWLLHRFKFNAGLNKRNSYYQFWTHDNHAEEIYSEKFFYQKLVYIHLNPVRAGFVEYPEHYVYSSAFDLNNPVSKIKISTLVD